jgi:hypothetical protein
MPGSAITDGTEPIIGYSQSMAITAHSTDIFRRMIEPDQGSLPQELARFVAELDFRPEDHARYEELSAKTRAGILTTDEGDLLDDYLHIDSLVSILRLKATRSLRA